jgi:hypothetical protein
LNRQSTKLPTLSHLKFHKKVIEVLVGNIKKKNNDPKKEEDQVEQMQKTV